MSIAVALASCPDRSGGGSDRSPAHPLTARAVRRYVPSVRAVVAALLLALVAWPPPAGAAPPARAEDFRCLLDGVKAVAESGFNALPISFPHAAEVSGLADHHADPFDRMLIAQARVEDLTIVTHDRAFEPYGVPVVWT